MAQRVLRSFVLGMLTVALLLAAGPYASPAHAETFAVTTTADAPHTLPLNGTCTSTRSDHACTLRAAVQTANALGSGPHTINLSAAGTYLLTVTGPYEDAAATGDLDLNNVNVSFANTSGGTVAIDGNGADRVFDVGPTLAAQLALSAVTVQNGLEYEGGGIRVRTASTLTLTTSTVSGNGAGGEIDAIGGGISNYGTATLINSTVSGNGASTADANGTGASASGGGIANYGTLRLENSTVSVNGVFAWALGSCCVQAYGGGIANFGTLTVMNSTLSGNSASTSGECCFGSSAFGGGIANSGPLTLTSSTLSGNSAASGGGISGGAIVQSTILANTNTDVYTNNSNCAGVLTSRGDNLSNDASCFDNDTTLNDRKDTDPLLGPLGNYGGPTQTHSLLAGSPAIDRVLHNPCPPPLTDQRGVTRPAGGHCDIGAFEGGATPAASTTPTPTATLLSTLTPTATNTSATPTATGTLTPTGTPTSTATPTATATPTTTATGGTTPTATGTATSTMTRTPTPTGTATATPCTFRGKSGQCR